jgi:MFS-type transporter involved in bile tolerance (Atg22 family)
VKKLALPIIVFSVLGMVSLFIPMAGHSMFSTFLEFDRFRLALMIAAFVAPIVGSVLALRAVKTESWHGILALAGFAVAFVKSELWSLISNITKLPGAMLMLTLAVLGGALCSMIAYATEPRS